MHKKRVTKIVASALIALVVVVVAGSVWLYTGKVSSAKEKVFNAMHLPIGMVGSRFVLMKDFTDRFEISKKLNSQTTSADEQVLKKSVYDGIIKEQKVRILAARHGISVSDKELNDEYNIVISKTNLQGSQDFNGFLGKYGLNESTFKSYMLKPELLTTKLVVWYNNQKNLNQDAYKAAEDLQSKLASGSTIETLAKNYSQDPSTQAMEGDMGFSPISELLPEIKEQVDSMAPGQVKLLASRYGLHLVKLVETDKNGPESSQRVHLKQIYLKAGDFGKWLDDESNNIKVRTFIDPAS